MAVCFAHPESSGGNPGQVTNPEGSSLPEEKSKMPKLKTKSGAKKRFKITGTGKVKKQQAGMRHNLEVKASKRKRALNAEVVLSKGDAKQARKLLGI